MLKAPKCILCVLTEWAQCAIALISYPERFMALLFENVEKKKTIHTFCDSLRVSQPIKHVVRNKQIFRCDQQYKKCHYYYKMRDSSRDNRRRYRNDVIIISNLILLNLDFEVRNSFDDFVFVPGTGEFTIHTFKSFWVDRRSMLHFG